MARPQTIRWDTLEPYIIGSCCEARKDELIAEGRHLPIWVHSHRQALKPLHKKRKEIGARQQALAERREAIRQLWKDGKITEQTANRKLAALRPTIAKTYEDAQRLMTRFERTSEKIIKGRGQEPHSRVIAFPPSRPWHLEEQILKEAAAHFSREFGRMISPRSIRAAWDWYRSRLNDLDK